METKEKNGKKKIGFLKAVIFSFIPLMLLICIAEFSLRVSSVSVPHDGLAWGKQVHPILGWDLKPNFKGYYFDWVTGKAKEKENSYRREIKINGAGFRDDAETSLKKPPGVIRIFTLGDSCTFGWGVESRDSFTKILERKLNKNSENVKYEVINAGVVGYSSHQGVLLLKHKLIKYNPDMIIVAYGWNSHFIFPYTDKERFKYLSPIFTTTINIGRKSYIYRSLAEIVRSYNRESKIELKHRVPLDHLKYNLTKLNEVAREHNINVVFMTIQSNVLNGRVADWTLKKHTMDNNKENFIIYHKRVNQTIADVAKQNNSGLLDVAEIFRVLQGTEKKELFYRPEDGWDDIHPNEEGHAVIAEGLFKYLTTKYYSKTGKI